MANRIDVAIDRDLIHSLLQRKELSIAHFRCLEPNDQRWLKQVFLELLEQNLGARVSTDKNSRIDKAH